MNSIMAEMRRGLVAIALSLVLMPVFTSPSLAFVGIEDLAERFPHVVQLTVEYAGDKGGLCTGVVGNDGIVSTAAHCVFNDEGEAARSVKISFQDTQRNNRVLTSRKIFTRPDFTSAYAKWRSSRSSSDFHRMTLLDIAFIVPDGQLVTSGLKNWITEVLLSSPYSEEDSKNIGERYEPSMTLLTNTLKQKIGLDLETDVGDLAKTSALVVGFGNNFCKNFSQNQSCTSDGTRRYGEVPLVKEVVASSGEKFEAPWIWCTGPDQTGLSPIRSGDSGGPLFIRAKDGRWLFAGHISGGNNLENCASSLLMHLDLWRDAVYYKNHTAQIWTKYTAADRRALARRSLSEYLESWSSDNAVALQRLGIYFRSRSGLRYIYNMQPATFDRILNEKKVFAEEWPKRTFKVTPDSPVHILCGLFYGPSKCRIRASVSWSVAAPGDGRLMNGISQLDAIISVSGLESDWLLASGPELFVENWRVLVKDGQRIATYDGPFKSDFQILQNTDFSGGDVDPKGYRDIGVENCYNLCDLNPNCNGYTHHKTKNWCWLKRDLTQGSSNPNVVSGVKR